MKSIITILAVSFFAFSANAGMRCTKDAWGNVTCYGTGNDAGYSSRTTEDAWGNTTTYDNEGNTTRCSKDAWGNVTCY